jgi:hypothetical protein
MDNQEILDTLGTQDTGRRQTKQTNPQHRKLQRRIPPKLGVNPDTHENDRNKI